MGAGGDRAGDRLPVDVAEVVQGQPEPEQPVVEDVQGVPASTVTVIASRSTRAPRRSRSGRSSRPSARAMSVNEWPEPTIFTVRPWRRAATTASTTSAVLEGDSTWAGRAVVRPDQLSQRSMR